MEKVKKWARRIAKEMFVEEQTVMSIYFNYINIAFLPDDMARRFTEGDIIHMIYSNSDQFEMGGEG
jgi:hypothetical protein